MPVYLLDENVHRPEAIIRRCKDEGVEVVRVHQFDLEQTEDSIIFAYAMAHNLIIVTGNIQDYRPLQQDWIEKGNAVPGVIYCSTVHYRNVEAIIQMILYVDATYEDTQLREWWV